MRPLTVTKSRANDFSSLCDVGGGTLTVVHAALARNKCLLLGGLVAPGGLFVVGKTGLTDIEFYARFADAGYTTVAAVAVSLLGLYFFNERFIFLKHPTNRRWAEQVA